MQAGVIVERQPVMRTVKQPEALGPWDTAQHDVLGVSNAIPACYGVYALLCRLQYLS